MVTQQQQLYKQTWTPNYQPRIRHSYIACFYDHTYSENEQSRRIRENSWTAFTAKVLRISVVRISCNKMLLIVGMHVYCTSTNVFLAFSLLYWLYLHSLKPVNTRPPPQHSVCLPCLCFVLLGSVHFASLQSLSSLVKLQHCLPITVLWSQLHSQKNLSASVVRRRQGERRLAYERVSDRKCLSAWE